jgi:hypothetical protein
MFMCVLAGAALCVAWHGSKVVSGGEDGVVKAFKSPGIAE